MSFEEDNRKNKCKKNPCFDNIDVMCVYSSTNHFSTSIISTMYMYSINNHNKNK